MIDVEMLRPTADEMLSGLSADQAMKKRLLFAAGAVEELPRVAGEMLGGLTRTPALRHRILVAAQRWQRAHKPVAQPQRTARPLVARFTPAVGMALVLALMIGLGVNYGAQPQLAIPAGTPAAESFSGRAGTGGTGTSGGYSSLYAQGEGANFPLIGVNGRFYRMLNVSVQPDVIGAQISEVSEFTDEPSLSTNVSTLSNVAQVGAPVYMVEGLSNKTACIAEVDGVPRLFQRVGYASDTIVGSELFEDTLDIQGQVAMLELSGVGIITDETDANELIYTLSEFAVYHSNDLSSGSQALTIYLSNGLSLQLMVEGDILVGCGAWTCPEFFETFEEMGSFQAV